MNFILPAYETMWRVVLRGVLEIHFRGAPNADEWRGLLANYLQSQDPTIWTKKDDVMETSAIDVIKEILRVYPPTRRIYRRLPDRSEIVSADLEKMHRNGKLATATEDPDRFRPERWIQIKQAYEDEEVKETGARAVGTPLEEFTLRDFEEWCGFMPFAKTCPAGGKTTQAFGIKMIALLVASSIQGFEGLEGQWELQAEQEADELPELDTALKSGREDYLSLMYRKVD